MFWAPSNKIRLLLVKFFQQCNHPTLQIENWQLFHNTRLHIFTFPFFWSERHQYFSIAPEVFIPVLPVPYLESLLTILSQRQLKQKEGRNFFFSSACDSTELNFFRHGQTKPRNHFNDIQNHYSVQQQQQQKKHWFQMTPNTLHTCSHISTLSLLSWTLTARSTS